MSLKRISQFATTEWVTLFLLFLLVFFVEAPLSMAGGIYFEQIGRPSLFGLLLASTKISLIIMPLISPILSAFFGSMSCIRVGLFLSAIFAGLALWANVFAIVLLFFFPFFLRIFNLILVPLISKKSTAETRSVAFAVRDVFLYIGCAAGFLAVSRLSKTQLNMHGVAALACLGLTLALVISFFMNQKEGCSDLKAKQTHKISVLWRGIKNRRLCAAFLGITLFVCWIDVCCCFLPLMGKGAGIAVESLFSSFALAYGIVPLLGLLSAFTPQKNRKYWYVFDLIFDVIPLGAVFLSRSATPFLAAVVLVQLKDFVKPVSTAYFFDLFEEKDVDHVWGALSSVGAAVGMVFPFIAEYLFSISRNIFMVSTLACAISAAFIACAFLPSKTKAISAK